MALDEIVGAPFDSLEQIVGHAGLCVAFWEHDATHGQYSYSRGQGEAEFNVVASCNYEQMAFLRKQQATVTFDNDRVMSISVTFVSMYLNSFS